MNARIVVAAVAFTACGALAQGQFTFMNLARDRRTLHEPSRAPRGLGVRQSAAAFGRTRSETKRQRIAALQNAVGTGGVQKTTRGPIWLLLLALAVVGLDGLELKAQEARTTVFWARDFDGDGLTDVSHVEATWAELMGGGWPGRMVPIWSEGPYVGVRFTTPDGPHLAWVNLGLPCVVHERSEAEPVVEPTLGSGPGRGSELWFDAVHRASRVAPRDGQRGPPRLDASVRHVVRVRTSPPYGAARGAGARVGRGVPERGPMHRVLEWLVDELRAREHAHSGIARLAGGPCPDARSCGAAVGRGGAVFPVEPPGSRRVNHEPDIFPHESSRKPTCLP
jgi:hypothetical protein